MNNQQLQRELLIWKVEYGRFLIQELLLVKPYAHKQQTKERGEAWKMMTDNLNTIERFHVSVRAMRERFTTLILSNQIVVLNRYNDMDMQIWIEECIILQSIRVYLLYRI